MLTGPALGQALKRAMELKGVTQEQVADHFHVKQPSVSEWIRFGRIGKKHLTELVAYFSSHVSVEHWGLPKAWGATDDSLDPAQFAFVRRADVQFANGVGKVAYAEDEKPPLVFRRDFLRKLGISEGDAVVVDGVGHSNMPKIPDGAVVLVNRGDRQRLDGGFFAFRASGELLIKRLETLKKIGVLATADNPDFKPKTVVYAEGDDFEVIGKAVWVGATI